MTLMESSWRPPVSAMKRPTRGAEKGRARGRVRCCRSMNSAATARSGTTGGEATRLLLLLLLLLLLGGVLDHDDPALAAPLGNLRIHGHVDVLHLLVEGRDRLARRHARDHLGLERLVGVAAVDALV